MGAKTSAEMQTAIRLYQAGASAARAAELANVNAKALRKRLNLDGLKRPDERFKKNRVAPSETP